MTSQNLCYKILKRLFYWKINDLQPASDQSLILIQNTLRLTKFTKPPWASQKQINYKVCCNYLCVEQPETMTAYFSTKRNPGVVLRVAATSPCQLDSFFFPWKYCPNVAIPLALVKMFSANRSPCRILLTGPLTSATLHDGSMTSPSWKYHSTLQFNFLKIASTKGFPQSIP